MFDWKSYLPNWRRAPADETVRLFIQWGLVGVYGALTTAFVFLSERDPLVVFTLIVVIIAFGVWTIRQLLGHFTRSDGSWGSRWGKPAQNALQSTRPVEFIIPSNWEAGFKKFKDGSGVKGARPECEEVHLLVRATEKMENVRLEIEINQFGISRPSRGVIAGIFSEIFIGTVPKGTEEKFLIMRRSYWITSAAFNHPEKDGQSSEQVRVEKGVAFFPDLESEFQAKLEENYHVKVRVLHDDGPDEAQFDIELHPKRFRPQTNLKALKNINPVSGR